MVTFVDGSFDGASREAALEHKKAPGVVVLRKRKTSRNKTSQLISKLPDSEGRLSVKRTCQRNIHFVTATKGAEKIQDQSRTFSLVSRPLLFEDL